MAPSFEQLHDEDLDEDEFDEDEIDLSDLREKYEVQLEQGYDTFVVIDGLPEVNEEQKPKLVKFLLKKLNQVGKTREDLVFMPMGEDGKSLRLVGVPQKGESPARVLENWVANAVLLGSRSSSTRLRERLQPPCGSSTWFPSTRNTFFASTS